jgi:hypothetical protein
VIKRYVPAFVRSKFSFFLSITTIGTVSIFS